jgi:antitoxin YefM
MDIITYTDARAQLAATMDRVCVDHAPILITRHGSQSVVMVSLDDWESLNETAYLLSSPANAARLHESILALESGQGVVTKDARELLG